MEKSVALERMREAMGKGADGVLATTSDCMEYHDRTCTYAELAATYADACAQQTLPPALKAAREQANDALRKLAKWAIPEEEDSLVDQCRFTHAPPANDVQHASDALAAFLPVQLVTQGNGKQKTQWCLALHDPDSTLMYWMNAVDHGYWGRFPWGAMVRWWHDHAPIIAHEINDRPDPIMAAPLVMVSKKSRQARLFSPPGHLVYRPDGQTYLPGFAPGEEWGPKLPVLPLALYDLGTKDSKHPGRGAPLALRLFIECILNVPLDYHGNSTGIMLPAIQLREMLPWLYGEGAKHYRPHTHWPRLQEAFDSLLSHRARIPWHDPETGEGSARLVVMPVDTPRGGKLDDWVRFIVSLPPGSERGPLIDRPALRKAGVASAPAYRMVLSLSFLWHDPGRLRVPYRKQHWAQTRQEDRYPSISDEDLAWVAYPAGHDIGISAGTWRKRLYEARKALKFLEEIGFAKITARGGIMPGNSWVGWGSRENLIPPSTSKI